MTQIEWSPGKLLNKYHYVTKAWVFIKFAGFPVCHLLKIPSNHLRGFVFLSQNK